jgi:DamX protein
MKSLRVLLPISLLTVILSGCVPPSPARYDLGKQNFISGNYFSAFQQLMPQAQAGNPDAQYAVGYMYFYGLGTPQDRDKGVVYIQAAAAKGHPLAEQALAELTSSDTAFEAFPQPNIGGFDVSPGQLPGNSVPAPHSAAVVQEQPTNLPKQASWPPPRGTSPTSGSAVDNPPPPPMAMTTSIAKKSTSVTNPSGQSQLGAPIPETKIEELQAVPVPVTSEAEPALTDPKKTLAAKSNYSVQLMAAQNSQQVTEFIDQYQLKGHVHTYSTQRDGQTWYVLTYGDYPNSKAAQSAIQALPSKLQKLQPWVRNVAQLSPATNVG